MKPNDTLRLVRAMLESDAADRSIIEACAKLVDDAEWAFVDDAYREDGDTGFDRGRAQGFQEGVAQGKRDLDTVAKARDALAMKLHELGKERASAISESQRLQIAMEWLRDQLRQGFTKYRRWREPELLPTKREWCEVQSADGKDRARALWDGQDFIFMLKRRLVRGERWSELKDL